MADKIYVEIESKVNATFDNKHKTTLPKFMNKAATTVIKGNSLFTTAEPATGKGFALTPKITLKKTDEGADCTLEMLIFTWSNDGKGAERNLIANSKVGGKAIGTRDLEEQIQVYLETAIEKLILERAIPEFKRRIQRGEVP